jgi:hypothetical protein
MTSKPVAGPGRRPGPGERGAQDGARAPMSAADGRGASDGSQARDAAGASVSVADGRGARGPRRPAGRGGAGEREPANGTGARSAATVCRAPGWPECAKSRDMDVEDDWQDASQPRSRQDAHLNVSVSQAAPHFLQEQEKTTKQTKSGGAFFRTRTGRTTLRTARPARCRAYRSHGCVGARPATTAGRSRDGSPATALPLAGGPRVRAGCDSPLKPAKG